MTPRRYRPLLRLHTVLALLFLAAFLAIETLYLAAPFWLDDSWTANSVREPSLRQMLRYDGWMQVTPPLFLFALRWGVAWAGADWIWRLLPFAGALLAAALLWRLLRREWGPAWAAFGLGLLLFNDAFISQAAAIKAFSWETAIGTALLSSSVAAFRRPARETFRRLYAIVCLLVLTGYSAPLQAAAASVLPAWALWLRRTRGVRGLIAEILCGCAASAAIFAAVYLTMLAPNTEPSLTAYWFTGPRAAASERMARIVSLLPGSRMITDAPLPGALLLLVCLPVMGAAVRRARARQWMRNAPVAAGWAMVAFAALGEATHLIPLSPRGGVYLVPWVVTALLGTLRMGCQRGSAQSGAAGWRVAALSAAAMLLSGASYSTARAFTGNEVAREDFRAAVHDLASTLTPSDRLIIHSTAREQFKYYSRRAGFSHSDLVWGDTAWPCCVRNKPPFQLGSMEEIERAAFPPASAMPRRVFFAVLTHNWHWVDCGGDERPRWRAVFEKRGCALSGSASYGKAEILSFSCAGS